jgi:redox-sensitive bicupin YhaK (pirin superfamily)
VHLVRGTLTVNGETLTTGDALRVSEQSELVLEGGNDAEVLVFDLSPDR